jgi:hypothetical protein
MRVSDLVEDLIANEKLREEHCDEVYAWTTHAYFRQNFCSEIDLHPAR